MITVIWTASCQTAENPITEAKIMVCFSLYISHFNTRFSCYNVAFCKFIGKLPLQKVTAFFQSKLVFWMLISFCECSRLPRNEQCILIHGCYECFSSAKTLIPLCKDWEWLIPDISIHFYTHQHPTLNVWNLTYVSYQRNTIINTLFPSIGVNKEKINHWQSKHE